MKQEKIEKGYEGDTDQDEDEAEEGEGMDEGGEGDEYDEETEDELDADEEEQFSTPEAGTGEDILGRIETAIPKTAFNRAKSVLQYLDDPDSGVQWNPRTKEMVLEGRRVPGSNIVDLIVHSVLDRRPSTKSRYSPGPPIGFAKFARKVRRLGVPQELLKNRRRWGPLYDSAAPRRRLSMKSDTYTPRARPQASPGQVLTWETPS